MSIREASDIFVKHSQFFEIYLKDLYIPRAAEMIVAEIKGAYLAINPSYAFCSTCNNAEWLVDANRYRLQRMKELENDALVRMTFPKQTRK